MGTLQPTEDQALNLVAAMILDAKVDMIAIHTSSLRRELTPREKLQFNRCRWWLLNGNGGLVDLLQHSREVNASKAIKELRQFAKCGYKTESIYTYKGERRA